MDVGVHPVLLWKPLCTQRRTASPVRCLLKDQFMGFLGSGVTHYTIPRRGSVLALLADLKRWRIAAQDLLEL